MRRRPLLTWASSGPGRRIVLLAAALAVLIAATAAAAWITRPRHTTHHQPAAPAAVPAPFPAPPATVAPTVPAAVSPPGTVARPPHTTNPVTYAQAAARMLWTYDTRGTSRAAQLAGMRAWMATGRYADWPSVSSQVPSTLLWSRMADQHQHATAIDTEAHYPAAFTQALQDDPAGITKAYVYAVTVTGTQHITWTAGRGAENRSVTLGVQCRPHRACALAGVAPHAVP
jgi:hypothetical protein